ncbi:MAG TPA: hypothetical protein PKY38_12950 [Opitutaceae bacterium]|nr:hypothetical protein [Opitutaceae bacterium]
MSLINDALKKAQRQRTTDAAGVAPPMPGESGGRITRRGKPMASQAVLLLVAGGSVLIVLSVVATVYLLREPAPPAAPPVALAAPISPSTATPVVNDSPAPAPVVFVPVLPKPESVVESPPEPPAPVSTPPVRTEPAPVIIASSPPPALPAPSPAAASPDERIHDYLDRLHVLGVRSSGADSRVLMNDRVYRLNDLVDRTLSLRLVDVQPGLLIFEDARGVRYTKNL